MRLSEIMSAAGLQAFAEIGLVLFAALFVGVLVYTFARRNRTVFDRASRAPLDEAPLVVRIGPLADRNGEIR